MSKNKLVSAYPPTYPAKIQLKIGKKLFDVFVLECKPDENLGYVELKIKVKLNKLRWFEWI